MDVIYIAIVSIGQQLVEIVVTSDEAKSLTIGDTVNVSTKAFTPTLSRKSETVQSFVSVTDSH